jgi:hypothetical protein
MNPTMDGDDAPKTPTSENNAVSRRSRVVEDASARANTSTKTSVMDEHTATYKSAFDGK